MSDLTDNQAAQSVKIVLADSGGVESGPITSANPLPATIISTNTSGISGSAIPSNSNLIGGSDGTNLRPILTDSSGRIITTALTGFGADFVFGQVTTAVITTVAVNKTVYTEQTVNAQRSFASSSASDAAAGTGARTIVITYLDQVGAGPYMETITLNGVSNVNTVATNICFVEDIKVVTVGSTGSNVGIITMKAAINGGGVTIATIAATDNQTILCHHYIPTGVTSKITGASVSHNGTTVGSGGVFTLSSKVLTASTGVNIQVSDFIRLYGQSSTFTRSYLSPILVVGPAVIQAYVTPETSSSTVYRCSIDFFEVA